MYCMAVLWLDSAGQRAEFFDDVKHQNFLLYERVQDGWANLGFVDRASVDRVKRSTKETTLLFTRTIGEKVVRTSAWDGVQLPTALAEALYYVRLGKE